MDNTRVSKFLSYLLRHNPESIKLTLDEQGWADINELITLAGATGKKLTYERIINIVEIDNKQRFALSANKTHIRAVQGHSLKTVDIGFEALTPPALLLHGTAVKNLESIKRQGLLARNRQYVHLTEDNKTAIATGTRYGKPVVLTIDSLVMHNDGIAFFQADNGVWLTEQVPSNYIEVDK